ncbi:MAG: site-specific DNA-methyltransferase [Spirochaetaceae bacterium]|nr:site-specific DNA-methyltransferase [Spirochaetaceae bacterium]
MVQKLELTWYGKENEIKVEPRLLIENRSLSNTEKAPNTENMLIHGDNLLALKALEKKYVGKVKCIYIDPPYNTGSAFEHYDDNLEHSIWLNLIRPRLKILWNMLREDDGSIWISIDDSEQAYMRVLCDELFGRNHFIAQNVWQKRYSRENREAIGDSHEYILVYVKNKELFKQNRNFLPLAEKQLKAYKNPDNDPRGAWQSVSLLAQGYRPNQMYTIIAPNGIKHTPPTGNCWKVIESEYQKALADNRITFGTDGNGVPRRKQFLSEAKGLVPWTWWPQEEVGHTGESKNEVNALFGSEISFATPKPERLIQRIIHIATNPGDLVLDSFLGSGTTAAVAHKMNRRYIGIEMGDHAYTHCKLRLDKVISGEDKGGITVSANWQGGGGYRFYELAPSLILKDDFDEEIINPAYNPEMLAAAIALHEGYTYEPDKSTFWKQSKGNEKSYLFVTTRHVTQGYMDSIFSTMAEDEFLIIACKSYDSACVKAYKNIAIKKIPQMLLDSCEFSKENYNLNIVNPPAYDDEEDA